MGDLLRRTAVALEGDPRVIASAIAAYCGRHGLDDDGLAVWLRLPHDHLPHLALCRRPLPADPRFAQQVADIAQYVGCDAPRLATLCCAASQAAERDSA